MTVERRPLSFAAARLEAAVARLDAMAETAPEDEFDLAYAEYASEVRQFGHILRQVTGMPLSLLAQLEAAA